MKRTTFGRFTIFAAVACSLAAVAALVIVVAPSSTSARIPAPSNALIDDLSTYGIAITAPSDEDQKSVKVSADEARDAALKAEGIAQPDISTSVSLGWFADSDQANNLKAFGSDAPPPPSRLTYVVRIEGLDLPAMGGYVAEGRNSEPPPANHELEAFVDAKTGVEFQSITFR